MCNESEPPYEEIDHTADVGLRVRGANLTELFANAAEGMFHLMCEQGPSSLEDEYQVELEAPDAESLLVDWLNELLYLSEANQRVLTQFRISDMGESHLRASARGGPAASRCKVIKAATYSNLEISRHAHGLSVTIVFDV